MHKLDRSSVEAPGCLGNYQAGIHTWDDLGEDRAEIRACLEQMQGNRCAYCECAIYDDGHIEHFRRKNRLNFLEFIFDWFNLFLSCNSRDHCGHYKDRKGARYNPDDLVKPDEKDPDDYFYFHSSGEVRPRSGLNPVALHQAKETIRVFHLDHGELKAARRRAIASYEQKNKEIIEELAGWTEQERNKYIAAEIQATQGDPYCTVIRHYFEKIC